MKFRVFNIIQSMKNEWNIEWKNFSMEWKIVKDMEYRKFLFSLFHILFTKFHYTDVAFAFGTFS